MDAEVETENTKTIFTSVDIQKAFVLLRTHTCIPELALSRLLLIYLQMASNFRKAGGGYDLGQVWTISNNKLADLLGFSISNASGTKNVWHGFNLITLNGENFGSMSYEEDGTIHKHGSPYAHKVALSKSLLNFFRKVKAGENITEEDFDFFLPHENYARMCYRKKKNNIANVRRCIMRKHAEENNLPVPAEYDYLSSDERKMRLYARPKVYHEKIMAVRAKQPTRKQKRLLKSWKSDFIEYWHIYGFEEALKRIKKRLKEAGYNREEYILSLVNIIQKRGRGNDVLFAINYVFNKLYVDIIDTMTGPQNTTNASLVSFVSTLRSANIPPVTIKKSFTYWSTGVGLGRDQAQHLSSSIEFLLNDGDPNTLPQFETQIQDDFPEPVSFDFYPEPPTVS